MLSTKTRPPFFSSHPHPLKCSFSLQFLIFLSPCLFLHLVSFLSPCYSTWAQVSPGHCNLHNGVRTVSFVVVHICFLRLCLLYDVAVTPIFSPLPTCLWFCDDLLSSPPSYMYFYHLFPVSSTCHLRAVCLYPSMCIPYSISPCSLTLYGAYAGHHCSCQSSFIRFCYVII